MGILKSRTEIHKEGWPCDDRADSRAVYLLAGDHQGLSTKLDRQRGGSLNRIQRTTAPRSFK